MLFISFDHSSNFVKFPHQRSLAKCSANLTTPYKNNMQMVTKCCVLLGEMFGSFDLGLKVLQPQAAAVVRMHFADVLSFIGAS